MTRVQQIGLSGNKSACSKCFATITSKRLLKPNTCVALAVHVF